MPHPDIRCSGIIPWYLFEVLRIEVLIYSPGCPTCYHPVTDTPGNCTSITSLIHYTTPGPQLFTCRHSRTRTLDSPSVAAAKRHCLSLACGTHKNQGTFQNIIYEPHVWGGRGSFSVVFLKFSYTIMPFYM
jgi:hypothetical protein